MTAARGRLAAVRDVRTGIAAVGVKELRGRMRGRRAFAMLTIHLVIVAGFAFLVTELAVRSLGGGGWIGSMTADIGRGLFTALLGLLTLIVLILAPASTAGAISLEREKQTLDMLSTTPISSLAIVLGKLLSALGWMALLLLASLPVMALVFMFGGVAPEDLVRAYIVLFATAVLYGSLGLFVSALVRRTQGATIINLVLVIAVTGGSLLLYVVLAGIAFSDASRNANEKGVAVDPADIHLPPSAMLVVNPFAAQADVLCNTETNVGVTCGAVLVMTGRLDILTGASTGDASAQGFGIPHDTWWPRCVVVMLAMAVLLILASSQLISPTRRWQRPRRRGAPREPAEPEAGVA